MECILFLFKLSVTDFISPVPFIMVVWGTIMSLMCLINSYQGLLVYALEIRVIHLSFHSY
jgi:hypothetical protein